MKNISEQLKEEHFYYLDDGRYTQWLYHNPDANSGDQFVEICFSGDDLEKAMINSDFMNPGQIFEYLEENCHQYLYDVGTYDYDEIRSTFLKEEPTAVGISMRTVHTLFTAMDCCF